MKHSAEWRNGIVVGLVALLVVPIVQAKEAQEVEAEASFQPEGNWSERISVQ